MLVTGLLITVYLVTGHQFMVPPLVAGCGLLAGVGIMQDAAIVFLRLPLGRPLGLKSQKVGFPGHRKSVSHTGLPCHRKSVSQDTESQFLRTQKVSFPGHRKSVSQDTESQFPRSQKVSPGTLIFCDLGN